MVMTLIVKTPRAWPDVVRHSQLHIHSRLTHTPMSATNGLPLKSPQSLIAWSRHIEAFGPIAPGFTVANRRARWSQAHRVSSSGTSRPDAASPDFLGTPLPTTKAGWILHIAAGLGWVTLRCCSRSRQYWANRASPDAALRRADRPSHGHGAFQRRRRMRAGHLDPHAPQSS